MVDFTGRRGPLLTSMRIMLAGCCVLGTILALGTRTPGAAERRVAACERWTLSRHVRQDEVVLVLRHAGGHRTEAGKIDTDLWDHLRRFLRLTCVDIDGDGAAEAILEVFSGGAHCCWDYAVFFDRQEGIIEANIDMQRARIQAWQDLDADGRKEAVMLDGRWDNFDDLSHAGSPFPPMVRCWSGREFIDCTERFPGRLEAAGQKYEDGLKQCGADRETARGAALGLLSVWHRLGREEDAWRRIQSRCPASAAWLRVHEAEIREQLSR